MIRRLNTPPYRSILYAMVSATDSLCSTQTTQSPEARPTDGLNLSARGLSTVEIAKIQDLSPSTVWRFLSAPNRISRPLSALKGAGRMS